MNIIDNFLTGKQFKDLQEYCNQDFKIVKAGDKEFSTIPTPEWLIPILNVDGHEIIFSFIRSAYKGFDNDLRIHADNIINGQKSNLAAVLYINNPDSVTPNGTSFWKHEQYGRYLPADVEPAEFDRLLIEDSNDPVKWEMMDFISAEPNRLLTYDSQRFHSKFPAEIVDGYRIVLAIFYKKIE